MKQNWPDQKDYPFAEKRFTCSSGDILHYVDHGRGPLVFFIHGTPSWSYEYRHQIQHLAANYRCIAPDHAGFGKSSRIANPLNAYQHSINLQEFIQSLSAGQRFNIVFHDIGGPIGIAAILPLSQQVQSITLLNTWLKDSSNEPDYIRFRRMLNTPLLPFLYLQCNISSRLLLPSAFAHKPNKDILSHYQAPYAAGAESRKGLLGIAQCLINDQKWFGSLAAQAHILKGIPIQILWGNKDPLIQFYQLENLQSLFPHSEQHILQDCGHFPQEENHQSISHLLNEFLQRNN
jgi:haloalkane dehalogenase